MTQRFPVVRIETLLTSGALATTIAALIGSVIVACAIATVRTGRWPFRLLLALSALVWPLPDHPLQGPVVLKISYYHGVHLADMVSIVALAVALLPWNRIIHSSRDELLHDAND